MLEQTMYEYPFDDGASSVYSAHNTRASEGGVSRSSRVVPFMLDMGNGE